MKFGKGVWAHYIKSAFEKYFMWKVKSGNIAPSLNRKGSSCSLAPKELSSVQIVQEHPVARVKEMGHCPLF